MHTGINTIEGGKGSIGSRIKQSRIFVGNKIEWHDYT
jgi:hypothetical protein